MIGAMMMDTLCSLCQIAFVSIVEYTPVTPFGFLSQVYRFLPSTSTTWGKTFSSGPIDKKNDQTV